MAGSAIRISILANAAQAKREIDSTRSKLGTLGTGAKNLAATAGVAFGGAAIISGVKQIATAASDAQQSLGGTQAVYGKYAKNVIADSNRAAGAVGLSANAYRESANQIGALLKNQGVSQDKLVASTKGLIKTGADLSATYGGTAKDAVEALSSAFKGEFDPLERYGISIKQSTVNTEALKVAQSQYGKALAALSPAQQAAVKRQATQNLITKQSTAASGQFQKQTNTLAEQQQILAAKFENVKAQLGKALLPILTKVFAYLASTAIPAISRFAKQFSSGEGAVGHFGTVVKGILGVLGTVAGLLVKHKNLVIAIVTAYAAYRGIVVIFNLMRIAQEAYIAVTYGAAGATYASGAALTIYNVVTKAAAIGTKAFAVAQGALNAVMALNPITLVVLAIIALVAIFIIAYKKSATFRAIVNGAFKAVRSVVLGAVHAVGAAISHTWAFITGATRVAFTVIPTVIAQKLGQAVGFVKSLPGRAVHALEGAGKALFNSGKAIIEGLIDGIKAAAGKVVDAVKGVLSAARDLLPFSPAKKGPFSGKGWTLYSGRSISEGLAKGIGDRENVVRRAALSLAKAAIPATDEIDLGGRLDARSVLQASVQSEQTITIKLSADSVSQLQRGREIQADLTAFKRSGGRGVRA